MSTPISDEMIQNFDSLKLLKTILSDYQQYFGELVVCLKNLSNSFETHKDLIASQKLDEQERKILIETFEKINKMLNNQEENNVKLGLKIFAEGQYGVYYAQLLAVRQQYPAMLVGANVQFEQATKLLQTLDNAANAANAAQTHSHNEELSGIVQKIPTLNTIIGNLPIFQLCEYWKEFILKINEGITQIESANKVLKALQDRTTNLIFYHLFSYAQAKKYIEGNPPDCKILVEKLMQDKTLGEVNKLVFSKTSNLVEGFGNVAAQFQRTATLAIELDQFSDKVMRICYLDQGFSLMRHHTVGYCSGDIRAWSKLPLKKPIQKKGVFTDCRELHEENASHETLGMQANNRSDNQKEFGNIAVTKIKSYQAKTPLFSETSSDSPEKNASLQEFIQELLNGVKETFEKNNYQGTIYIGLHKKGDPAGHAIGLKILNQNGNLQIYFRDVNVGEFYCNDFQLFQKWFVFYFCRSDTHKAFDHFDLSYLKNKQTLQDKSTPGTPANSSETKVGSEAKELKEVDESLRTQILDLLPQLQDETQAQEGGLKIIEIYEKMQNKNESDHFIAYNCCINCSQWYPDGTVERQKLCIKAVELHKILVDINPEYDYLPLAELNLVELYLQNLKYGKLQEGIKHLRAVCEALIKIDLKKLDDSDPENVGKINTLKEQAQGILTHLSTPGYPRHFIDLMAKFKEMAKFIEENLNLLCTEHVANISNNTLHHNVEELEFGEGELSPEENPDQNDLPTDQPVSEAAATPPKAGSPQGLHFQYTGADTISADNAAPKDKPKSPAKP